MKKITSLMIISLLAVGVIFAGGNSEKESISVSGTGIVTVRPDTASITFAVVTRNERAMLAANENAHIMTMVNEVLLHVGIAKEDIATNDYRLYQDSFYNSDTRKTEYTDYVVSNNVSITVKKIDTVGDVIDAVLATGVNRLTDVSFYAKDTEKAYDEARKLAVQEALSTATILAEAAGTSIGKVVNISENSGSGGTYGNYARKEMAMVSSADYSTPIAPGSTEVSVTVNIAVELK